MKQILKLSLIFLFILMSITSCKKNKIDNEYFENNDWELYKVNRFDDNNTQNDITYLFLDKDCRKNNSNRFFSNNLYVNQDECPDELSDAYYYDTLHWYYDNEEQTKLHLYSVTDISKEYPYFFFEILKVNETELELKEIPLYEEGYYYIRYFNLK